MVRSKEEKRRCPSIQSKSKSQSQKQQNENEKRRMESVKSRSTLATKRCLRGNKGREGKRARDRSEATWFCSLSLKERARETKEGRRAVSLC